MKPLIAERAKEKEHERKTTSQKSDKSSFPEIDTKKELATLAGVSHDTIHKVETIERYGSPELKEQVRNKEVSINKAGMQAAFFCYGLEPIRIGSTARW